tara:strand:+ start:250 stop:423 length:174 start_codon:yes stop_codon:yes gene_type:complete
MKKETKLELLKLLFHIHSMGDSNSMVRKYIGEVYKVNLVNRKDWRKFIDQYTNNFNN